MVMDSLVCWNVRGINNTQKQLDVKKFLSMKNVGAVSLLETKVKAPNLGDLYHRVFAGWCFTSNLVNHKGGRIILAWNPNSFNVNIIQISSQMIHCRLEEESGGKPPFWCTFIYAFNSALERCMLWRDIKVINEHIRGPWVLMGTSTAL